MFGIFTFFFLIYYTLFKVIHFLDYMNFKFLYKYKLVKKEQQQPQNIETKF